jgi:glycosyltransferase involved in cell wall biosynthesis
MNRLPEYSKPLQVLFFATYVSRESGASYALRETVKRVRLTGVRPWVMIPDCPDSREMFPEDAFEVVYCQIKRPRRSANPAVQGAYLLSLLPTFLSLRRFIYQKKIDVVHCNEITDGIAALAARSCGVPCVYHVRADGVPNPYRWLLTTALKATADAIVVPSESTEAWIGSAGSGLAGRIRLIYDYAFDLIDYQTPMSGGKIRTEFGIPDDAILVILVSKLILPKGHPCFIRAAEKVLTKSPNVYFLLVGGAVPGHEAAAAEIKALAEQLVPAPALRLIGVRPDLPALYAASDIAVHCPTYPDTYPTVVLLPMLAGKPVIGSDIGGIPEQIEHERTGILVPCGAPQALADAILDLAQDPAKRSRLGSAARKKITEGLAPETQGRLLTDVYREVLAGSGLIARAGLHPPQTEPRGTS